ncbi:MAG: Do family serine endopeptidase [Chlamydiales bacterium]|nr:Do family serine endopeptidase [Chlamydiales bacterium]NCF70401.1 Do family serine endopeptidase [Chlamydiales bacterium]
MHKIIKILNRLSISLLFIFTLSGFSFSFSSGETEASTKAEAPSFAPMESEAEPNRTDPSQVEILKQTSRGFAHVAETVTPAVVFIETEAKPHNVANGQQFFSEGQDPYRLFEEDFFRKFFGVPPPSRPERDPNQSIVIGQGSGFLISANGYILTNNHVIQNADIITVRLNDKREYQAEIIGTDQHTDIALIKIESQEDFPFLALGNAEEQQVGSWVVAIGNPFGLQASVTVGTLSAKGRNNLRITDYDDFLQTDAAINHGNSGGPLTNADGEVIGINTAIVNGGTGVGFAIPSSMVKYVVSQLMENGAVVRGYLGINLQPIDSDLAKQFGLKEVAGTIITQVIEGTPADKAGLKQGDIILEYNGYKAESLASFRLDVSMMKPGSEVSLKVDRDGEVKEFSVIIGTTPEKDMLTSPSSQAIKIGIEVESLTPEIAEALGYTENGVIIKTVIPGSPADHEGLRPGNLILSINRETISGVIEFNKKLQKIPKGKDALLLVQQGQLVRYVLLAIPN